MAGLVLTALVTVAAGATAVSAVAFGPRYLRPLTLSASPPGHGSPTAARPLVLVSVPAACDILPTAVVRRLVPTARPAIGRMGTRTASVCTYSVTDGRRHRAVRVDARSFLPEYLHDRATALTVWSFEAQWRQAEKDLTSDTSALRRLGGLGDAAFERYWIDRDTGVAVGEATVRDRNVLLRVQYTEERPAAGDRAASERRCLAEAIAAARAGLETLR